MLGIPTGVKMHSGVFATTPESAGDVAARVPRAAGAAPLREAEVVDVDEDAVRAGAISTRLYGAARVPDDRLRVQATKASAPSVRTRPRSTPSAPRVADAMDPRRIYVLGPGTTTRRVMRHLGLPKTLLGVDAVRGRPARRRRLGERELLALLDDEPATLVVGVVGGQGALLRPRQPAAQPGRAPPGRRREHRGRRRPAQAPRARSARAPRRHRRPGARRRALAATAASTSRRGRTLVYKVAA